MSHMPFGLALVYSADPDAVAVLSEHATGSFQLLIPLYAAQEHRKPRLAVAAGPHERNRVRDRVLHGMVDHARNATETDLLEGLHTARTVLTWDLDSSTISDGTVPELVSGLFALYAPAAALTDNVAAEMTVHHMWRLTPELGLETRKRDLLRQRYTGTFPHQLTSRYLLSRFGTHAPSWDMFNHLQTSNASTGDIADMVAAVEQQN